jgi:CHASE3 domain sensor protein
MHEKITGLNQTRTENIMEAENINAIGNQLADLSTRVNELRGYL